MTHGQQWHQAMQAYPRGAGTTAIAASIAPCSGALMTATK